VSSRSVSCPQNLPFDPKLTRSPSILSVQLWDPRVKPEGPKAQRSYAHHWDYITDFLYYEDKKQLVSTSWVLSPLCQSSLRN
jgi:hypothetical protein